MTVTNHYTDVIKDQSYSRSFNYRHYNHCPGCAGVELYKIEGHAVNDLCDHCEYERRKILMEVYQIREDIAQADKARREKESLLYNQRRIAYGNQKKHTA